MSATSHKDKNFVCTADIKCSAKRWEEIFGKRPKPDQAPRKRKVRWWKDDVEGTQKWV